MTTPTTQAHVAFDPSRFGVLIQIRRWRELRAFDGGGPVPIPDDNRPLGHEDTERATLRIEEDEAHALYEALGEYFGHAGASTMALRADYDAERKRVDRLIEAVVKDRP